MRFFNGRFMAARCLLSASSVALVLSACSSPNDDGEPPQVTSLTGTITGTILDTDGTPIAGAIVRYAGATESGGALAATTNADGQFSMSGVTVTGVSGTATNDANGPITLAIAPPTSGSVRYMGATVQALPTAQSTGTVGGGTVFIDNFNVGVGVVRLPALASTVSGVLRDSSTGAALAGASVSLDFVGVEFGSSTVTGVATSYDAGSLLPVISAADGRFELTSVFNDSCLQLSVSGFRIDGISGSAPPCPTGGTATDTATLNLRTRNASSPVQLASVALTPFTSADTTPPVVSSLDGVIDPTQAQARLESRVTTTFTLRFSEPMQAALDAGDVAVVLGTAPNQTAAAVASASQPDAVSAQIVLAQPLPANTAVSLRIAREALKDSAGNGIADGSTIAYDSLSSQELVLSLISFASNNTVASAATASQLATPAVNDLAYLSTDALIDTVDAAATTINPALTPTSTAVAYDSAPALEQLNSSGATAALAALKTAIAPADTRSVQTGTARVRIGAPADATDFVVSLERGGVKQDVLFYPVVNSSGNPRNSQFIDNGGPTYVITPGGASSFDLLIVSRVPASVVVQPGDVFKITSRNAGGVLGGSSSLTLQDIGRPSVALQLLDAIIAGAGGGTYTGGGGGVITPGGASSPATVLLSITPQAADVNDSSSGYAADSWRGDQELLGLSHVELRNDSIVTTLPATSTIGDADGTQAFLATAPVLGIALTEPSVSTGGALVTSGVSTTVSASGVLNGVTNEDGSQSDLLAMAVGGVFALAADASPGTATIDVSAAIRDRNGLTPDTATRAQVRLRDLMPPLMTLGFYDGSQFVIRFNEPITKTGAIAFESDGCRVSINVADSDVSVVDARTLSFPASKLATAGVADINACFVLPAYAEDAYNAAALAGLTSVTPVATPRHGTVSYANVPDTSTDPITSRVGHDWATWSAERLGITTPRFAIANIAP